MGLGWEVGGSGVGREGMGEQQATGSSSVPALLPPPPRAHLLGGCSGTPFDHSLRVLSCGAGAALEEPLAQGRAKPMESRTLPTL